MTNLKKPNSKAKVIFFGNERLATGLDHSNTPTLKALLQHGYNAVAVITNHSASQSRKIRELEVEKVAKQHNIPIFYPKSQEEILGIVKKHPADIGILVAFGKIVTQEVIDCFPHGIINVHPSLLPKFRGPTPIEQAILNGELETGVSIMQLTGKMDAGPTFAQKKLRLNGSETKSELAEKLGEIGSKLIIENLPKILNNTLKPQSQAESKTSYCSLISKQDGLLDPDKTAVELEREIRAYAGWPKSFTEQNDQHYITTCAKASREKTDSGKLIVKDNKLYFGCKNGSLEILEIQPAGKAKMSTQAFIQGYKNLLSKLLT
jgi:methionyl-tRNA formyltransferase